MSRYSFSGKGEVILKAAATATYGGKQYEANEPIAFFKDVMIDISFSNVEKLAKSGTSNLVASSESEASFFSIQNIATTESLQSLLYKKKTNKTNNQTIIKVVESSAGIIYLPVQATETLTSSIFIFDAALEKMTTYTFDPVAATITGLANGLYTVFYQIDSVSLATFTLQAPSMPNIKAEVRVIGNLNGVDGTVVIHLNRIKLLTRPTLDFNSRNPFVDQLDFAIIHEEGSTEVNYYG